MNITNYNLFPSIVSHVECSNFIDIQQSLVDWIYAYKNETKSVVLSNRGGWQSPADFYYNNDSFRPFYDYIWEHIVAATSNIYNTKVVMNNMWINVNGPGNYNVLHQHPICHLSGAMWIQVPENSGNFVFNNPNYYGQCALLSKVKQEVVQATNFSSVFTFFAQPGNMIVFPPDLMHLVEENKSNEDRISISFNLNIE